ncbi:MAG: hypothetical protein LBH11_06600 [Propionibacteriaceae bacterium]|nr:hypothetical protein [Propionibacteriaceae bacterium]
MGQLVFVPVSRVVARELGTGHPITEDTPAFSANAALAESFGLTAADGEAAEFAALTLASIYALATYGERLVLVAELPADPLLDDWEAEAPNGGVRLGALSQSQVTAFFTDYDDPQTTALLDTAAQAAQGLNVDAAWELPEVSVLLERADLLWHDVTELEAYFA